MKVFIVVFVVALSFQYGYSMNEKQMKSAAKLIRNSCQPKTKISDEEVDNMHKGIWSDDQIVKCYANCVLTMAKVTQKNGSFDYEGAMKQIPSLPENRQEPTRSSMEKCSKLPGGTDKCDTSWIIAKCIYFDNPENYFLP